MFSFCLTNLLIWCYVLFGQRLQKEASGTTVACFYRLDTFYAAQPTVSKHRHKLKSHESFGPHPFLIHQQTYKG